MNALRPQVILFTSNYVDSFQYLPPYELTWCLYYNLKWTEFFFELAVIESYY